MQVFALLQLSPSLYGFQENIPYWPFLCFLAGTRDEHQHWLDVGAGSTLHIKAAVLGAGSELLAPRLVPSGLLGTWPEAFTNATLVTHVSFPQAFQTASMGVADWHGLSAAVTRFEAWEPGHAPFQG